MEIENTYQYKHTIKISVGTAGENLYTMCLNDEKNFSFGISLVDLFITEVDLLFGHVIQG